MKWFVLFLALLFVLACLSTGCKSGPKDVDDIEEEISPEEEAAIQDAEGQLMKQMDEKYGAGAGTEGEEYQGD